jgi:hypothetical protein
MGRLCVTLPSTRPVALTISRGPWGRSDSAKRTHPRQRNERRETYRQPSAPKKRSHMSGLRSPSPMKMSTRVEFSGRSHPAKETDDRRLDRQPRAQKKRSHPPIDHQPAALRNELRYPPPDLCGRTQTYEYGRVNCKSPCLKPPAPARFVLKNRSRLFPGDAGPLLPLSGWRTVNGPPGKMGSKQLILLGK